MPLDAGTRDMFSQQPFPGTGEHRKNSRASSYLVFLPFSLQIDTDVRRTLPSPMGREQRQGLWTPRTSEERIDPFVNLDS